MFDYVGFLYDRFGVREIAHAELATRPENKLGTDEDWDRTEGILLRGASSGRGSRTASPRARAPSTGRRSTSTWTTRSADRGRWGRSSSTASSRRGSAARYMGPDNREHMPYVIHRALFGSLERFVGILHRVLRRRLPLLARAGPGARRSRSARAHREAAARLLARPGRGGLARRRRRARRDRRQADPRRGAGEGPLGRRLRATGSPKTLAVRVRGSGGDQNLGELVELRGRACYPLYDPAKQERIRPSPPGPSSRRFNRVDRRGITGRCVQRFHHSTRRKQQLGDSL